VPFGRNRCESGFSEIFNLCTIYGFRIVMKLNQGHEMDELNDQITLRENEK
jgi:hypothetical protein